MQPWQVAIIKKSGDQLYELSKELRVSEAEYRKVCKLRKIDLERCLKGVELLTSKIASRIRVACPTII
jgi:hypothetical protein